MQFLQTGFMLETKYKILLIVSSLQSESFCRNLNPDLFSFFFFFAEDGIH